MESDLQHDRRRVRDGGLSLIELVITVSVLGLIMTTLAGVIVVALRSTPPTEARVDDARGLQGLVTWLPQDVDAAPPDGFDRNPAAWPCAGTAPADSYNILAIDWTESTTTSTNFDASYRYERTDDHWNIVRYFCTDSGAPERINLTSELTPWDGTNAYTVMCSVVVDASAVYDGTCPAADTFPASVYTPSPVRSLKFKVELENGLAVTIDAAPKNPDESLADDPEATANQPPTVQNTAITLSLQTNETKVFDLAGYLGAVNDPDGAVAALTVSVDPTEPMPVNLVSATTAYTATTQFELTLTAGAVAGTSDPGQPLMLIVSDERGGWKVVQAQIVVSDPPDTTPPWLDSGDTGVRSIGIVSDQGTTVLDIPALFNIRDDRPTDRLNVSLTSVSASVAPAVPVDMGKFSLSPDDHTLKVTFSDGLHSSAGGEIYAQMTVTDAGGNALLVPLQLTILILPHSDPNTAPVAAVSNVPLTIEAGQSVTLDVTSGTAHGVTDSDVGDFLSASVTSAPSGIAATAVDTTVTIDVAPGAPVGVAAPVVVRVSDLAGAYVDVTVTVTVTAPPPVASNCVLQSLSTSVPSVPRIDTNGSAARLLAQDVVVTLQYSGTCDGLRLNYNSGHPSGLGTGVGLVFDEPGSPTKVKIVGAPSGTEKFSPGSIVLTASTSSDVAVKSITTTLVVT